jgi:hypothetical protein
MAIIAQTIQEGRDHILRRIGSYGSTEYQAVVLEMLNHALSYICGFRDWAFMRKKTTVTTTDATGTIEMPDDLNRILAMYESGTDIMLTHLDPLPFCQAKEDGSIDESLFFCEVGYSQDTSTEAPHLSIEVYTAPASGTTYQLWYVKHLDEWVTADLATVPLLPPFIWNLIIRKATLEMLKHIDADNNKIAAEHSGLVEALVMAAKQEDNGSSHFDSIQTLPSRVVHKSKRFRR